MIIFDIGVLMATTGIWKITTRLDHVINYVTNIDKTINANSYKELHNMKEYEKLDCNTEELCYVSSINCSTHNAYKDMMFTKEQYNKKDKILGYHAFQSFKEGEISADKAHLIGLKLAEEMWGDRFEVIVTTHVNTNHIHNHFVINSVSFKDGKKYHDSHESYSIMRNISDSLCEEYGLSVVQKESSLKSKVNYDNYYKGYVSRDNYHTLTKADIDRAIGMAYSYNDFENIMLKMGYDINIRYGKISVRKEPYKKNIRIERAFGSDYTIEAIEKRIENTLLPRVPFLEELNSNNKQKVKFKKKSNTNKNMSKLFNYYCYLLKVYPQKNPRKFLSKELQKEVKEMDKISEQTKLLLNNKIKTYEQLLLYKENLDTDIKELSSKREYLWKKYNKTKGEDTRISIKEEINTISKTINLKKKELKLCNGIESRSNVIEKNIEEIENTTDREKDMLK